MIDPKLVARLITENVDEYAGLEDNDEFEGDDENCVQCGNYIHPIELGSSGPDVSRCGLCDEPTCEECGSMIIVTMPYNRHRSGGSYEEFACPSCSASYRSNLQTEDSDEYAGLEDNDEFGNDCVGCGELVDYYDQFYCAVCHGDLCHGCVKDVPLTGEVVCPTCYDNRY